MDLIHWERCLEILSWKTVPMKFWNASNPRSEGFTPDLAEVPLIDLVGVIKT